MTSAETAPEGNNITIRPDGTDAEFVEVSELLHADAGDVRAERVAIEQSTAGQVTASEVSIEQSAIRQVQADSARIEQSAMLILKSSDTALHDSAAGILSADRVDLHKGSVGIVKGPVTIAEGGSAQILIQIGGGDSTRPVLNGQSALRLGAGLGLSLVVFSRFLRRVLGD